MSKLFKDHLLNATNYRGGKPRPDSLSRDIIKLSSNENQFGPSPKALKAIANHLDVLHEYPDPDDQKLRQALENHYQNRIRKDQFFCAPSGSEIIDIICHGFLNLNDEVIVCSPTFTPFIVFPEKIGAKIIDVPLIGDHFDLDIKKVLSTISDKTKLIFLASPNNPVGNYIPKWQLRKLVSRLPSHVILVFDEVYHHYTDADDYSTALDFVDTDKNIIGLNSFSKVYGLAGLRLGFGYASLKIASYLRILCKPFLLSTLAIQAGMAALEDRDFVAKTVLNNSQQKEYLYRAFDALDIKYWPTQANFILIQSPLATSAFEKMMLDNVIMVRPADNFGAPGCVRITIGRPDQNRKLINALQKVMGNTKLSKPRYVA